MSKYKPLGIGFGVCRRVCAGVWGCVRVCPQAFMR